jgi:hypothetical protein
MSWVDDAFNESEQLAIRNQRIESGRGQLYDDLWKHVTDDIQEINKRGRAALHTNGTTYNRIVSPTNPIMRANYPHDVDVSKDCHIKLEGRKITVSGYGIGLSFDVDVCPDGVVCLKQNGEHVKLEKASMMILRPLAFPELPKQKTQTA